MNTTWLTYACTFLIPGWGPGISPFIFFNSSSCCGTILSMTWKIFYSFFTTPFLFSVVGMVYQEIKVPVYLFSFLDRLWFGFITFVLHTNLSCLCNSWYMILIHDSAQVQNQQAVWFNMEHHIYTRWRKRRTASFLQPTFLASRRHQAMLLSIFA